MLEFESSWIFNPPSSIPDPVYTEFHGLITMTAKGKQEILEKAKERFAYAAKQPYMKSSSAGWADSDLQSFMVEAAKNAPVFIEAFYEAIEIIKECYGVPAPSVNDINQVLKKHNAGFEIVLPYLYTTDKNIASLISPSIPESFDIKAKEVIEKTFQQADRLLKHKQERPAVQELLWLLESISTVFEGSTIKDGKNISGDYFNKIIPEIRNANKGNSTEEILNWVMRFHWHLSAPKGGRIRHGSNLKDGVATTSPEAKLYYNLTVSYIDYLMSEYERVSRTAKSKDWI